MQETEETGIRSLGAEDYLEEGLVTHSSIFAWRISWTKEPGGLRSMESQSRTRLKRLSMHAHAMLSALKQEAWCWVPFWKYLRGDSLLSATVYFVSLFIIKKRSSDGEYRWDAGKRFASQDLASLPHMTGLDITAHTGYQN